jgi:hypothetical protein
MKMCNPEKSYVDINREAYDKAAKQYAARHDNEQLEKEWLAYFSRYTRDNMIALEIGPGS